MAYQIEVFLPRAFVRPFETFDALSAGVADIYHREPRSRWH